MLWPSVHLRRFFFCFFFRRPDWVGILFCSLPWPLPSWANVCRYIYIYGRITFQKKKKTTYQSDRASARSACPRRPKAEREWRDVAIASDRWANSPPGHMTIVDLIGWNCNKLLLLLLRKKKTKLIIKYPLEDFGMLRKRSYRDTITIRRSWSIAVNSWTIMWWSQAL